MFFKLGFLEITQYLQKNICVGVFICKRLQHMCFLVNIVKLFDSKPPVASVDLLFLIKSNVGWFLLKRADLVIVRIIYTLLVETISTHFY